MQRRDFLKAGGLAALGLSTSSFPAYAAQAAADIGNKKRVGLIGSGWYGKADLFRLIQVAPVEVVSLCDVDSTMLKNAAEMVATRQASKNENLCQMLENNDDESRFVVQRIILLPGRLELGLEQLRGVVGAMRSGDAVRAEELRRLNIRSQKEFFARYADLVLDGTK